MMEGVIAAQSGAVINRLRLASAPMAVRLTRLSLPSSDADDLWWCRCDAAKRARLVDDWSHRNGVCVKIHRRRCGGKNPQASRGTYSSSMSLPLISLLKFVSSGYFCFALAIIVFMLFSNNSCTTKSSRSDVKSFVSCDNSTFVFAMICGEFWADKDFGSDGDERFLGWILKVIKLRFFLATQIVDARIEDIKSVR